MNSKKTKFIAIVEDQVRKIYNQLPESEDMLFDLEKLRELIFKEASDCGFYPDVLDTNDLNIIERNLRSIINVEVRPTSFLDRNKYAEDWYTSDFINNLDNFYWERYKSKLIDVDQIPIKVVKKVDDDSRNIVKRLGNPKLNSFSVRGMVIGHVQSGKTMSYAAVINKAIDAGYKLIIVLAGLTESLRNQTQDRINSDVIGKDIVDSEDVDTRIIGVGKINSRKNFAAVPTSKKYDFNKGKFSLIEYDELSGPIAIVVKKNKKVLEAVNKRLASQNNKTGMKKTPVLIIDDEADNASVNTADPDQDPKAINHEIRKILNNCSQVTYLAYTATPMANIFIDPDKYHAHDMEDLFPKDFIVGLGAPSNYCGGDFYFNDEIDNDYNPLHSISDSKKIIPSNHKKDHEIQELPNSLIEALNDFFIASAIKDMRRQNGNIGLKRDDDYIDSMLINISRFTDVQNNQIKPLVEIEVEHIFKTLKAFSGKSLSNALISNLKEAYDRFELIHEESWDDVITSLRKIDEPKIYVANAKSQDSLEFKRSISSKFIVIGGFMLSRGLTIPGLTVSYFIRNTVMYDTLMQMGRWFGYRDGYRDLVKLYMQDQVISNFSTVTNALNELFDSIMYMNSKNLTPEDFGLKIKGHPILLVTAKNKMKAGEELKLSLDFSNSNFQTWSFLRDQDIQKQNFNHTLGFIESISSKREINDDCIIFRNIDCDDILNFLLNLNIHKSNSYLGVFDDDNFLYKYIKKYQDSDFKYWDFALPLKKVSSNKKNLNQEISDILGVDVSYEERSLFYETSTAESVALSRRRSIASQSARKIGVGLDGERKNPILIIHFLKGVINKQNPDLSQGLESFIEKNFVAAHLDFPPNPHHIKNTETYVVNKRYLQERGLDSSLDDEDDYEL
jgi:hypothetical protein